jgi:hypothetical protein
VSIASFDHLVGPAEPHGRQVEAERLRSLEVDREVVLGGRLHRQVGRLLAFHDEVDVFGSHRFGFDVVHIHLPPAIDKHGARIARRHSRPHE